jgi:hypothetical protein
MRSAVVRSECKRMRAGRASLFDQRVQEGIEQHVDSAAKKGVLVELLHHIAPHLKDKLQVLRSEEAGWTLVAFHVWIEHRRLSWTVRGGFPPWTMQVAPSMAVSVSIAAMLVLGLSGGPGPCRGGSLVEPELVPPGFPPPHRPLEASSAS